MTRLCRTAALCMLGSMAALLAAGCATEPAETADLAARSSDPRGLLTGLPAAGEKVCLSAASDHPSVLDISVRRALRDCGYDAVILPQGEEPKPKRCRFAVTIYAGAAPSPADLPDAVALEYRDFYTGETQRASWRKSLEPMAWRRAVAPRHVSVSAQNNLLVSSSWGDMDMIVRELVDQLFPAVQQAPR